MSGIKLNDGPTYSYLFLLVGAGAFIMCGLAIWGSAGVLVKMRVVWLIGFTESRASIRTKHVRKLIIFFLIPTRFPCNKVHIPPYYSTKCFLQCAVIFLTSPSKVLVKKKKQNKNKLKKYICSDLCGTLLHTF